MVMGKDIENAYALIIGISEYKDPGICRLNYTHADAEGMFKLLTDPKNLGLSGDKVKILLDQDATLFNIKDAISNWLYKNADKDSVVFIFFAGHGGVEEDPRGIEKDNLAKYLIPYDAVLDNLYASAFSNRDFNDLLLTIRSKKLVIFMDSCYSGGVSERIRDVKITDDPYKKLGEGEGRLVIAASQPDQRSYEDSRIGHGVFTYNLLEALSGKADWDDDGFVSVIDAWRYLQDAVPRDAMKLAGGEQEPIFRGDITRDFVISVDRERLERNEKERVLEKKLKILDTFYDDGKFSGKQYEYLRALLKFNPDELLEKDNKIAKRINDLISGNITIPTFLDNMESFEPKLFEIPEKTKQEQKRLRREGEDIFKEEKALNTSEKQLEKERKDIEAREKAAKEIQLPKEMADRLEQDSQKEREEKKSQRDVSPKWKWESMIASIILLFYFMILCYEDLKRIQGALSYLIFYFYLFCFLLAIYFMYKERTAKIDYVLYWVFSPILIVLFSVFSGHPGIPFFLFVTLVIPAIVIDISLLEKIFAIEPKSKWVSMIISLGLNLLFWNTIYGNSHSSFLEFLLLLGFPAVFYLMYKERTTRINYGLAWILFPIITLFFELFFDRYAGIFIFILFIIPAIVIDLRMLRKLGYRPDFYVHAR